MHIYDRYNNFDKFTLCTFFKKTYSPMGKGKSELYTDSVK